MTTATTSELELRRIALRSIEIMATGTREDFAEVLHPAFFNHEQRDEPPATRGSSVDECFGVAQWLRAAYADLGWEVHEVVGEGDLVVVHCTMSGRHAGDFVAYDVEGRVDQAFAPTGKRFASTQSHWLRMADRRMIEHWANRDDMGSAEQLGWVPPTPLYLLRCALAKRRAKRAADPPRRAEERPFPPYAGELSEAKTLVLDGLDAMRGAPLEVFERLYHPEAYNREQVAEPPAARGRGPATFLATSRWLTDAFAEWDFTVHHMVAEADLVVAHLTMSGRHVAPIAMYDEHGEVDVVFPPTGRRFAATQTHWLRLADDGRILEHWANRDDLGMAMQLGWIPPTPRYLARMALAKRRTRA
jgi:predicted ester cyclase